MSPGEEGLEMDPEMSPKELDMRAGSVAKGVGRVAIVFPKAQSRPH